MSTNLEETNLSTRLVLHESFSLSKVKDGCPLYNVVEEDFDNNYFTDYKQNSKIRKLTNFKINNSNEDILQFCLVEPELQISILTSVNEKILKQTEILKEQFFNSEINQNSKRKSFKFEFIHEKVEFSENKSLQNNTENLSENLKNNLNYSNSVKSVDFGFYVVGFFNNLNNQNEVEINNFFTDLEQINSENKKLIKSKLKTDFKKFENINVKFYIFPNNPFESYTQGDQCDFNHFSEFIKSLIDKKYNHKDVFPFRIKFQPVTSDIEIRNSYLWKQFVKDLKKSKKQLYQLITEYNKKKIENFLNDDEKKFITQIETNLNKKDEIFVNELKDLRKESRCPSKEIRSTETPINKKFFLFKNKIIDQYINCEFYKQIIFKIKEIDFYNKFQIEYINKSSDGKKIEEIFKEKTCLLCYNLKLKETHSDQWERCFTELMRLINKNEFNFYKILNFDICKPSNMDCTKLDLMKFENGALKSIQNNEKSIIAPDIKSPVVQVEDKKNNKLPIIDSKTSKYENEKKIVVIKNNQNILKNIRSVVKKSEFGKDEKNNKQPIIDSQTSKYENQKSIQVNENNQNIQTNSPIEPIKRLNILLLGESGVGKSTFINSLHKYIKFKSLEEAKLSDQLTNLIGSEFHFTDYETKNVVKITTKGDQENEIFVTGQSTTQKTKSYTIKLDEKNEINIIDTPGMGDTRGLAQDQKNFKEIIEYLSKLEYLNAICFLVKPNISRLSPGFKYCFKELFSYLNKRTIDNLIFCFTNARETMMSPGNTFETLQTFLKEIESSNKIDKICDTHKNIFCFENESIRYLGLIESDTKLDPNMYETCTNSWEVSADNSRRLIDYVNSLQPFGTHEIIIKSELNQNFNINLSQTSVQEILKIVDNLIDDFKQTFLNNDKNVSNELDILDKKFWDKFDYLLRIAQITRFLQNQSITIYNDNFEAKMEEMINNKHLENNSTKWEKSTEIKYLKNALQQYKKIKDELNLAPESLISKLQNTELKTINVESNSNPTATNVQSNSLPTNINLESNSIATATNVQSNSLPTNINLESNSIATATNVQSNSEETTSF